MIDITTSRSVTQSTAPRNNPIEQPLVSGIRTSIDDQRQLQVTVESSVKAVRRPVSTSSRLIVPQIALASTAGMQERRRPNISWSTASQ